MLAALGLYHKSAKVLFLGLDNAGKTTLLNMLKNGKVVCNNPTLQPNQDELLIGKIRFKAFDLGGHESARKLWKDYFASGVDGVVFIVDAVDYDRFPEAKEVLDALLKNDKLHDVPFVILGNKIDLGSAASEDDLRRQLGLQSNSSGKESSGRQADNSRPIGLYMCSVVRKMGYGDGFKWLAQFL